MATLDPDGRFPCMDTHFTKAILLLVAVLGLAGCGVVAAPVRGTSAVVKVVPVAGDVVAAPLDVTADVID